MEAADGLLGGEGSGGSSGDGLLFACEVGDAVAVHVKEFYVEADGLRRGGLVLHLALYVDGGLASGYVDVRGIDVGASGAEVRVKGKCLVEEGSDVEVYVFVDAAIVGVETHVVPLVLHPRGSLHVGGAAIHAHGYLVLTFLDIGGDVEAEGHHAVVIVAHPLAVDIDIGTHTYPSNSTNAFLPSASSVNVL